MDSRHPQPHFFSSRDVVAHPGRFDLASPVGTCYYTRRPVAAILEVLVDPDDVQPQQLFRTDLAGLSVWECSPEGRSGPLADSTVPSVPGLTGELATVVPYTLPWAWADALHAADRTGIVYTARLGAGEAVALFGPSGVPSRSSPADGPALRRSAAAFYADLPVGWRSDDTAGHEPTSEDYATVASIPPAGST